MKPHYRTIVLSDIHLGIQNSHVREVVHFLRHHTCDKLILNGDIIDGWQLRKSAKWKKKHTSFFKLIMKWVASSRMQVIYLRGNHDDFLDEVLPLTLGNFSILRNHIHHSGNKKYFVVHGDIFDSVTTKLKWIARLGDTGYTFLLWINRHYNDYRRKKGLPYYSLSQVVKAKVKQAVSFISDYEKELCAVAENEKCDGVICGHIHQADNKFIGDIHYLNSGDWVETLSAIVETEDHEWKIVYYQEWLKCRDVSNPETLANLDINDFSISATESSFSPEFQNICISATESSDNPDFRDITLSESEPSVIPELRDSASKEAKASSGPKFEPKHFINAVYEDK